MVWKLLMKRITNLFHFNHQYTNNYLFWFCVLLNWLISISESPITVTIKEYCYKAQATKGFCLMSIRPQNRLLLYSLFIPSLSLSLLFNKNQSHSELTQHSVSIHAKLSLNLFSNLSWISHLFLFLLFVFHFSIERLNCVCWTNSYQVNQGVKMVQYLVH